MTFEILKYSDPDAWIPKFDKFTSPSGRVTTIEIWWRFLWVKVEWNHKPITEREK